MVTWTSHVHTSDTMSCNNGLTIEQKNNYTHAYTQCSLTRMREYRECANYVLTYVYALSQCHSTNSILIIHNYLHIN